MNKSNLRALLTPIVLALAIVLGMMINRFLPDRGQMSVASGGYPQVGNKLDVILGMVQHSYVDTVNMTELIENSIPLILNDG